MKLWFCSCVFKTPPTSHLIWKDQSGETQIQQLLILLYVWGLPLFLLSRQGPKTWATAKWVKLLSSKATRLQTRWQGHHLMMQCHGWQETVFHFYVWENWRRLQLKDGVWNRSFKKLELSVWFFQDCNMWTGFTKKKKQNK